MCTQDSIRVNDDYDYLLSFLPTGWKSKAKELGALRRCRKIPDAETLLRVLLIHLAEGCSFRETAVRAARGGIIEVSDVAIMERLKGAGEWFRWMNTELMQKWITRQPQTVYGDWNVCVVDGTRIKEPGPTGSSWCVHYSIFLPSLMCNQLIVVDKHGSGETFRRFNVNSGDLFLGDRAYGSPPGIRHVVDAGGNVVVRFGWRQLPLWAREGERFDLFGHLRTLRGTHIGDWIVEIKNDVGVIPGRVCAVRKSRQATEKAIKQVRRKAQKRGNKPLAESLEAAEYVMVFTTAPKSQLKPMWVLEMYRGRWQIELVFKRLKSIMGLGHLRKGDATAANAWIQGKLFVALLIEALIREGEIFFPWGYPLRQNQ